MWKVILSALICTLWWFPAAAQLGAGIQLTTSDGYVVKNYPAGTGATLVATVNAWSCSTTLIPDYSCTIICRYSTPGTLTLKETSPQQVDKGTFGTVAGTRSGEGSVSNCSAENSSYSKQIFTWNGLTYAVGPPHTLMATVRAANSNPITLTWAKGNSATAAPTVAPNTPYALKDTVLSTKVTGYRPTGTVNFIENGLTIASATVKSASDNATTFSATVKFPLGPHSVTASYGGDGNNNTSASSPRTFTAVLHPASLAAIDEVLNIILMD